MADTAATLTTALTGNNNDIDFTAAHKGRGGNTISIEYVVATPPAATTVATVNGSKVTVTLNSGVADFLSTNLAGHTNNDLVWTDKIRGARSLLKVAYLNDGAANSPNATSFATVSVSQDTGTLTSDNTNVSNGDVVRIRGRVYVFKTTLTGAPLEILIGASADASLTNLVNAINGTGTPGTDYSAATQKSVFFTASAVSSHATVITAIDSGSLGYLTSTNATHLSWGAATMSGGGITTISFHLKGTVVKATGTLTSDNTAPSDGDTVTIGASVYTFKTALTPTVGQVLIAGSADAALLNLIRAINGSGTPGTDYATGTPVNASVTAATSVTAHAFLITAIAGGAAGNSIASTETSSHLSFGGATLSGGSDTNTISAIASDLLALADPTTGQADVKALVTCANKAANDGTGLVEALAASALGGGDSTTINTTGAQVLTAITAGTAAARLLSGVNHAGNDGTGVVTVMAESFLASGAGASKTSATGTATSDNTNAANTSTITIGSITYTFVTSLSGAANEVKIGASADATLLNLINAISRNDDGSTFGAGITYGVGTLAHPEVTCAQSVTAHAFLITARTAKTNGLVQSYTAQNLLASTSTTSPNSHITFGGTTLSGGTFGGYDSSGAATTDGWRQWSVSLQGDKAVGTRAGTTVTVYFAECLVNGENVTLAALNSNDLIEACHRYGEDLTAKGHSQDRA